MNASRTARLGFILVTVFLDVIGIGLMIPVLPGVVGELAGHPSEQALWYGAILVTYGCMQFFCAPLLGALSDRFGRRPVLLLSIAGLGISHAVTALTTSLWLLLASRLVSGATGASFSVAHAYVADITTPAERSRGFALIGATLGLGFIIGPALGGALSVHSLRLPFEVAAGLALLNTLYGWLVLPESLSPAQRKPFSLREANAFAALGHVSRLQGVGPLLLVFALCNMAQWLMHTSWVLFTSFRFGWTPADNGLALCLVGLVSVLAQGLLMPHLVKRWEESRVALAGMVSAVIIPVCYGLSQAGWLMYVLIPANLLSFMVAPALQSLVSRAAPADEQGLTIGALNAITSLATVFAPLLSALIMAQAGSLPATDWRVGGTFFLAALLQAFAVLLALGWLRQPRLLSDNP